MRSELILTGIGLREPHHSSFLETRPPVAWVEIHSENFFCDGGPRLKSLEQIRRDYPVSMHSVNLSLGSADDLNWQHLRKLKELSLRIDPCLISDHLAWTSINGQYLHDLLPLPYIEESLNNIISRIRLVQDYLQKQILIENISSYFSFNSNEMNEWDFLREVAQQSGCGILLDVSNIYISAKNHRFDPKTYIHAIPSALVQEIHLGGFSEITINNKSVLIDSHNKAIDTDVWELYRYTTKYLGRKPTIIEWDADLPSLQSLYLEAQQAEQIMRESYVPAKLTG